MKPIPLGVKLTLWSAIIVAAALICSALASDLFVSRTERHELDRELRQTAHHFFEQFRAHGSSVEWVASHEIDEVFAPDDPTRFVLVRAADGRALFRTQNLPVDLALPSSSGMHDARIGEVRVRFGVFRENGLILFLAGATTEITELTRKLMLGHLVALPLVLLVVALGGWWLARQALEPVKAMADAADLTHPEQLGERLPETSSEDEIGRLTRAFNQMLDRLQRGFLQATRFSTDASHELRTPLAVLRGSIEQMLADPKLSEVQRDAVADLQSQTQRLVSITNTLLLLARADAGRLQLQLEDRELRDILGDCLEDAGILAEQHEVRIERDLGEAAPVRVDAGRIRQVVLNLLDNAVKFNIRGGRVQVALSLAGGQCRLRIGSTGPGISEPEQVGLFERFFRAGQHEDTPGAGLGLSLARELARSHGGDVKLISSRAGWTEFELVIPARATA